MYDSHVHTKHSPDSSQTIDEVCEAALKRGLSGIAVTDHSDMWFFDTENDEERIRSSIRDAEAAGARYDISVFRGVELAEQLYAPDKAEIIMTLADYDIILGSVHSVLYGDWADSYSRIDFGSADEIAADGFLREYFKRVLEMSEKADIDVLCHLTCPLRYINGRFGKGIDIARYAAQTDEILSVIIEREIALEVNTSELKSPLRSFMPGYDIIKRYYDMGGRLVTIGSDAHAPERVGSGLSEAKIALAEIGFKSYNYFKGRQPQEASC